jgi:2-dehydro-3-deoxygalactonokinase
MNLAGTFIAVDWGTTNRRAYRVEGQKVVAAIGSVGGVLATEDFPTAIADIRAQLGDVAMLLAGMVGSNRGWVEVPYVVAPAGLQDLARALHAVADDIAIVPGVRTDEDIMRGEEVQALGAVAAGLIADASRICHPGTHAKWIDMAGGAIAGFRTALTGELFGLLKAHSILAPYLKRSASVNDAFFAGVDLALAGEPLLDALFGVRSRLILGNLDEGDAPSFTSGLVIGTDVAAHAPRGERVALLGDPQLCTLYEAALGRAGCPSGSTDGAQAFVAGMIAIRNLVT